MSNTSKPLSIVAVVGSPQEPSKTGVLVDAILAELAAALPASLHVIRMSELGPSFAGALDRRDLPVRVEEELRRIEQADVLIAASPVYRASFTGLFKHLFDFVDQYALVDTPVLIAATGGSERHSLILEHQLRPLFGFFQALTLPQGIYAASSDFDGYELQSPVLAERIQQAVTRGLPLIKAALKGKRKFAEQSSYAVPVLQG